jgi:hypothetical protein
MDIDMFLIELTNINQLKGLTPYVSLSGYTNDTHEEELLKNIIQLAYEPFAIFIKSNNISDVCAK